MIRETEVALLAGLTSKHHPRIPTIEVGKGRFTADFSARFWEELLDISDDERAALLATLGPQNETILELQDI